MIAYPLNRNMQEFGGYQIVESVHLVEQYRFPRTKNRRIRKKWSKRAINKRPMTKALVNKEARIIYCHPTFAQILRYGMNK